MESKLKFTKLSTKRLCLLSLLIAVSMILSYVESLLPAFIPVPGVKLGLANIVTVITLILLGVPSAICVSIFRVLLSSLLFGSVSTLIYSLFGAALSLLAMALFSKINRFSTLGVSVLGGVFHNIGQILAATLLMENSSLLYYLAPLVFFGTLSGALIGVGSGLLAKKLKDTNILK